MASTTRRSAPIAPAMWVAGISMPFTTTLPSSFTPKPFSRRNFATLAWAGESAKSFMIRDHMEENRAWYINIPRPILLHVVPYHEGLRRLARPGPGREVPP